MRTPIAALVLGVALISLAGCGKSEEQSNTSTVTTSPDGSGGTYTVTDSSGGTKVTMGSGSGASAKTPAFAPLYPGAEVLASVSAAGAGAGGMVSFKTKASPDEVIEYYKKAAAGAGLGQTYSANVDSTLSFSATDEKTKHSIAVAASKDEAGTNVQLTWSNGS